MARHPSTSSSLACRSRPAPRARICPTACLAGRSVGQDRTGAGEPRSDPRQDESRGRRNAPNAPREHQASDGDVWCGRARVPRRPRENDRCSWSHLRRRVGRVRRKGETVVRHESPSMWPCDRVRSCARARQVSTGVVGRYIEVRATVLEWDDDYPARTRNQPARFSRRALANLPLCARRRAHRSATRCARRYRPHVGLLASATAAPTGATRSKVSSSSRGSMNGSDGSRPRRSTPNATARHFAICCCTGRLAPARRSSRRFVDGPTAFAPPPLPTPFPERLEEPEHESWAVMTKVNCRPSLNSDESSLVIVMFEPTRRPLPFVNRGEGPRTIVKDDGS